jgi:hypothetical protein
MSRAAHCGSPGRVRLWLRVEAGHRRLDPRASAPRDSAPQVDLVGVLGLSRLRRQAQGLRVRRDSVVGHVPLGRTSSSLSRAAPID